MYSFHKKLLKKSFYFVFFEFARILSTSLGVCQNFQLLLKWDGFGHILGVSVTTFLGLKEFEYHHQVIHHPGFHVIINKI